MLSVAGDWSFIPSSWKTTGDEDPRFGIPTTYYAAVQLDRPGRDPRGARRRSPRCCARSSPTCNPPRPSSIRRSTAPASQAISGLRMQITDVRAKFKYGGNVDQAHREAVLAHLPDAERARRHRRRRPPPAASGHPRSRAWTPDKAA